MQKASETISQVQQTAIVALQKASVVEAGIVQLCNEMERAIQVQLQALGGVSDTKISTIVQDLSANLSSMVTQSQEQVI